jgi:hypothetical protein
VMDNKSIAKSEIKLLLQPSSSPQKGNSNVL